MHLLGSDAVGIRGVSQGPRQVLWVERRARQGSVKAAFLRPATRRIGRARPFFVPCTSPLVSCTLTEGGPGQKVRFRPPSTLEEPVPYVCHIHSHGARRPTVAPHPPFGRRNRRVVFGHKPQEEDYRGTRFRNHSKLLKNCTDVMVLTPPKIIEDIHRAYLEAGSDIIETNTFNGQVISMAEFDLQEHVFELNRTAAEIAPGGGRLHAPQS